MKASLWPREHGATAELAFPLLTGLGLAGFTLPGMTLALAAVAFFLAHEPLAVLLGARGARLKAGLGEKARPRAVLLLFVGIILAAGAGVLSGGKIWPGVLLPAASAGLLVPLVLSGKEKSLPGEFLVIAAFSTMVLPLGAVGGVREGVLVGACLTWMVSFGLGTLEVHAIKAGQKQGSRRDWARWASPVAASFTILASAAGLVFLKPPLRAPFLAVLPPAVAIQALSFLGVHPKHLKRVGWTLVGADALALGILLAGGRG